MQTHCPGMRNRVRGLKALAVTTALAAFLLFPLLGYAQQATGSTQQFGGEASLVLPDLSQQTFLGFRGDHLLMIGIGFCFLGGLFGFVQYTQLRNLPVHRSMREISELIYETCKTYLITQGKFIAILEVFIAAIIVLYFGFLLHYDLLRVLVILGFSVVGILGSYGVAWFGIRVNTFANSRTAFASLAGKPYPAYAIPLKAGMSIGMMLISVELLMMLCILLFIPGDYAGPCFIGFAIGESLGAAALRIAGGIFTKIADIGSDLMKIVFKIKEDDARNPGVIADCTGDNAGDSVGPSADGFETYGVTGVALITFILLGVTGPRHSGAVAGLDFCHARHHAGGQRRRLLHQRRLGQGEVWQRRGNELRGAAHFPGLDHLGQFHRPDVCCLLPADSHAGRRSQPVVEALRHHLLRHAGGRADSGTGQGLHLHRIPACEGNRHFLGRRGRLAQHSLRSGGG